MNLGSWESVKLHCLFKNSKWFLKLNSYRVSCTETRRKIPITINRNLEREVKLSGSKWNWEISQNYKLDVLFYLWVKTLLLNLAVRVNIENRICGMVLPTQEMIYDWCAKRNCVLSGPSIISEFWAWDGTEVPSVISSRHYLIALIFPARNAAFTTAHLPKCPLIFSQIRFQRKL